MQQARQVVLLASRAVVVRAARDRAEQAHWPAWQRTRAQYFCQSKFIQWGQMSNLNTSMRNSDLPEYCV